MRMRQIVRWTALALALALVTAGIMLFSDHVRASQEAATTPGAAASASNHTATIQQTSSSLIAGSVLTGRQQAPGFSLIDQYGRPLDLAQLRGHPVFLTFMDATCKQECPVTAQYLNWTSQFLGAKDASQVAWIAVSVNPTNTAAEAHAFIAKNKPGVLLRFGLGSQQQLSAVWNAYHITVIPAAQNHGDTGHTVVFYLIDKQGREREIVDQGFDPKQMAHDLRTLLSERG